ncbi:MAG: hypothetical protein L3K26_00810 [Candidatus Hydrogenedentes bacterium]|nr:hypothetical protein [Candidatus Hydrogenedentota bacterium]
MESAQTGRVLNPLTESAALRAAVTAPHREKQSLSAQKGALSPTFRWNPSGSAWLDIRANRAQIEIHGRHLIEREVKLIDTASGNTILSGMISGTRWQSDIFIPVIGVAYKISVPDGFADGDNVRIRSLLPVEISP